MTWKWKIGVLAVLAGFLAGKAYAQPTCSVSIDSLSFGSYSSTAQQDLDGTAAMTVTCTEVSLITIDLGKGVAPSYSPRYLSQGPYHLNYNLYLDAARQSIWGDNTGGSSHFGPSTPPSQPVIVYGRIFANQNPAVGSYSDSIAVTISY